MKKGIELLAPAGSVDALHAAVENGADAVYLGGKLFNARQQADNFDTGVLKEALKYAHARGVNLYLTLNTLIADEEMKQALLFAAEAGAMGIDGIIVQDLGLAGALRKVAPEIPLHASTQMTIFDLDGVKALEEMGFSRVVLARELSLEEASKIAHFTKLEVETFIHGALCICYSGQCLMSSIIGGRSGNRGKCAQPCRLPYELLDDSDPAGKARYLMSPKDMSTLDMIGAIAASGIHSLKIEGRMKSPEYVAVVVRTYRKYLDMALDQLDRGMPSDVLVEETDKHDLLQIFNRGGFSTGYWKGKTGADMMCYEKPNNSGIFIGKVLSYDNRFQSIGIRLEDSLNIGDGVEIWTGDSGSPGGIVSSLRKGGVTLRSAQKGDQVFIGDFKGKIVPGLPVYKTTDAGLNKAARESFNGRNPRRVEIRGHAELKNGLPLSISVSDDDGNEAHASGTILPEEALNRPLTEERLAEQVSKTGSTPFAFRELIAEADEGLSLPVSEINEVRRSALDLLLAKREDKYAGTRNMEGVEKRIGELFEPDAKKQEETRLTANPGGKISLYFYKWDETVDYAGFGADRLYLPAASAGKPGFRNAAERAKTAGAEVFLWLPAITRGNYSGVIDRLLEKPADFFDGILAGNIGMIRRMREQSIRLAGDSSINVFNSRSVLEVNRLGLESIALSPELTLQQIRNLTKGTGIACEASVYGRLPLMTSEYCPAGCVAGGCDSKKKCTGCCDRGEYRLKDRMGAEFPVLCDRVDCRSAILNSNVLFVPDALRSLLSAGVSIFRLFVWDENPGTIGQLVQLHRDLLSGREQADEERRRFMDSLKAGGFTKGHYFRGV